MSHWSRARIRIKNPNPKLVETAVQILAAELTKKYPDIVENRVVAKTRVKGWQGTIDVDYAIPAKLRYGDGIGIIVKNDGFEVIADVEGTPLSVEEIAGMLNQYYVAAAVAAAAEELGWEVANIEQQHGIVAIDVVTP